jgi:hypothetical protein
MIATSHYNIIIKNNDFLSRATKLMINEKKIPNQNVIHDMLDKIKLKRMKAKVFICCAQVQMSSTGGP